MEPHADQEPHPLNRQEAMPDFGGNEQLFRDLLTLFVGHQGEGIARLRALKDSGDAPAFAPAAYSINGIAATFCAVRLQQAAQQLEALGFDDNLGAADAWIEQLEAERPGLEAYLKGLAPR